MQRGGGDACTFKAEQTSHNIDGYVNKQISEVWSGLTYEEYCILGCSRYELLAAGQEGVSSTSHFII